MKPIQMWTCVAGVALALAWVAPAGAVLTAAQKCEKLKNKAAGMRALCTAKERGKEIAGRPFDYARCSARMSTSFTRYETNAMGACPTTGDAADIDARIDGSFNPSNALPKALSGVRFVDNGDGTVTDTQTGRQWEKKDSLGGGMNFTNPHDADNLYTWNTTAAGTTPDGTVFTDFLQKVNNCTYDGSVYTGGFAGHCDWRLPTVEELLSIVDLTVAGCGSGGLCISAVFGPTPADTYSTSTTSTSLPDYVWIVNFYNGSATDVSKDGIRYFRAVRGGS